MRHAAFALLALLLLAPAAPLRSLHAEDEMDAPPAARTMLLGPAKVLASRGTPEALDSFLPGGKRPAKLVWPLPEGPLLVLGLPHQDELAQQIADAFQIPTDDLDGGYRIAAWRTKTRPICVVMADDAAALAAARFEFETTAPMEMVAPDMRSLDFKRPNQQAGVAVQQGTRLVRPRYAYRAWAPYGRDERTTLTNADVAQAAGAHANRLWFRPRDLRAPGAAKRLAMARRHGIVPVLSAPMFDATIDRQRKDGTPNVFYPSYVDGLWKLAVLTHGIRHFSFTLSVDPDASRPRHDASRAVCEEQLISLLAVTFFPKAEELLIVPGAHASSPAKAPEQVPDLRRALTRGPKVSAASAARMLLGWSGPHAHAAGVPVVLLDRWAEPFQAPTLPYVPSLPRGRAASFLDTLAGAVVFGRKGTEATLESLWAPLEAHPDQQLLAELTPVPEMTDTATWLAGLRERLAAADKENLGLVPWLGGLKREIDAALPHAAAGGADEVGTLRAPPIVVDGRLTDPAWKAIGRTSTDPGSAAANALPFRLLNDGSALHLGVRIPKAKLGSRELLLRVALRRPGSEQTVRVELTSKGWTVHGSLADGAKAVRGALHEGKDAWTAELRLDRVTLGGDPHPGRVWLCRVAWGPRPLWPAQDAWGVLAVGGGRAALDAPR